MFGVGGWIGEEGHGRACLEVFDLEPPRTKLHEKIEKKL
jgi:hypothetical protein